MIELLINCGSFIIELFNKQRAHTKEQKDAIAQALEDISVLLGNVAISLEKDEYPTGSCEAMHALSSQLLAKLYGVIEFRIANELSSLLQEVSNVERMYALKNPGVIEQIKVASGKFYAASVLVRI